MAGVDELEEQDRAVLAHRQIPDLVDHEECGVRQDLEPAGQAAGRLGLRERLDQARQRPVVNPTSGLGGSHREADGDVRFPHAGRTEQDHVLGAVHEAELMQALDLLALDAGLEGEVELGERLHRRQPGGSHRSLQAPVVCAARSGH